MQHHKYEDSALTIQRKFTAFDYACFHDAIINASKKHLDQFQLYEVWNLLPLSIQITAIEWGMSDTEFGDKVYKWAEENLDKLERYPTWED